MAKAKRGRRPRGGESGGQAARKAPPRNTNVRGGDAPRKKSADKARRAERSQSRNRRPSVRPRVRGIARLRAAADGLLHLHPPEERVWKYFRPVLALAFAARAAIALSGDFILHPDEIMQYLEQGHRLVFGNGIVYWEFFYGQRSWLLPGLIGGVLKLFDAVGLGEPRWYVGAVKLTFCVLSLSVPAGMYCFARRHFDETAARTALLAGAFWYELAGFAHKPLTSFVATSLLMALLALCVRPVPDASQDRVGSLWLTILPVTVLAVLAPAIRMQYAPLALILLGIFALRAGKGATLPVAITTTVFFLAVGVFDAITWDAGLFHSYLANIHANVGISKAGAAGASPASQYLWWIALASGGLGILCMLGALSDLRRYGFLLLLVVLVLFLHSTQPHKEYRYVFAVIPLWLLVGAGLAARFAARTRKPAQVYAAAGAAFAAVSVAGVLNVLPDQHTVYESAHTPKGILVRFLRGQDPVFAAYRYLAGAPGVHAVWQPDRHYHSLPGYYYLHRRIPYYDASTGPGSKINQDLETLRGSVSHILAGDPNLAVPGYVVEKAFGDVRILRREENDAPVRRWRNFTPTIVDDFADRIMRPLVPDAPPLPSNAGVDFVE